MWVVWQPLGAKGLLRSGLPQLYAFGPASQASPVSYSSPPVPYRAAHQAHREQRGTGDHSNCQCFGRLSGKPAWRGPPVPKLPQCSPLSPLSDTLKMIYLLWGFTFSKAILIEKLRLAKFSAFNLVCACVTAVSCFQLLKWAKSFMAEMRFQFYSVFLL